MQNRFNLDTDSNKVIESVKAGLESAFERRGLDDPKAESWEDNVKIQKLTYRVIEHFDIPVIRTWYKYGQFEPYGTLRPKYFSPSRLDRPDQKVPSQTFDDLTREEIEGYFLELEDLEEEWDLPLFEFLEHNYENEAEDEYRDIYLSNLGVIEVIEHLTSDEDVSSNADQYIDDIKSHSIDLWYEMKHSDYFGGEEVGLVRDFLDDLQTGLVTLAAEDEPTGPQLSTIEEGWRIYHNQIWPWPAMEISIKEAKGPHDELRNDFLPEGREYLNLFETTFPREFESWRQQLYEVGLISGASTYQSIRGGTPQVVGDLEKATLNAPNGK